MRLPLPDSILGRTALVLVSALLLGLAAAMVLFAGYRRESLEALGGRNAAERVAAIARLLEETPPEERRQTLRRLDTEGFRAWWGEEALVEIGDGTGFAGIVARGLRRALEGREVRVAIGGEGRGPGPGRAPMMHGAVHGGPALRVSVGLADGTWLNVFAPLPPAEPLWRAGFVTPLLVVLALVIAAALWAVRRAARPFASFAAAAERLGVDVAAPPMPEDGPREVRKAAQAFNLMQARIRRFVEDRTQMLAAISHDLRTPITRLRLRAEFVEDDIQRDRMLADLEEMETMIAATLAFARDDAAREPRRPADLAALLAGLVEDLRAAGRDAAYEGPDSLVMAVRPAALKRALSNLLDNAVKYGKKARARIEPASAAVTVIVEDEGPGIPEADRERVFQPFVRLEGSRSRDTGGVGLGLSVARAALRAHGGDLRLAERPGGGLQAIAILPAD